MKKIMFVCHGNICRSPMAEFVLKKMVLEAGLSGKISVASSATSTEEIGNDIHYGTRRILDKYSVPYSHREAAELLRSDYDRYDIFVGMDSANIRNMKRIFAGDAEGKVVRLLDLAGEPRDVADPWYTQDFEATYRDVVVGCSALLAKIRTEL